MKKINIGMIGLGLMGGSFSLGLKKKSDNYYFIGMDHNLEHSNKALELGLVDEITTSLNIIQNCDVIILSIPVDGIISVISKLTSLSPSTTVIDLGSTKEKISNSIPQDIRANIVTAHPMTGTENFGPSAAIEHLYNNKVVVLCDLELSGEYQNSVAYNLFNELDMQIVEMNSKDHDLHASFISHMPHALSFALANSVLSQEDSKCIVSLAGGGFKDMSRIAKSSPNMWEDIFRQNRENMLTSIHSLQSELKRCEKMIENEEWDNLNNWMKKANNLHSIL